MGDRARNESPTPARYTSTPPEARVAREQMAGLTAALGLLLGAMTDWLGMGVVGWLMHEGKVGELPGLGTIGALATGTIIAKAKGNSGSGGGSTSALVFGVLGTGAFKAAVLKGALGKLLF